MGEILIIDKDPQASQSIINTLGSNFSYKKAFTLNDAYLILSNTPFVAIILEINLENESGFELFKQTNNFSLNQKTPIIIFTNNTSISDKVHAFSIGAEDYILKDAEPLEVRARVEARIVKELKKSSSLKLDGLIIEPHFQKVFKQKNSSKEDIQLTPIEFKILYSLIESKGRPLSRDTLINRVWDEEHSFESRGIDAHVSNLRKKLGSHSKIVGSVYGVGYVYRPITKVPGL